MKYYYKKTNKEISNYNQWEDYYKQHDEKHWEEGRSAQALADFMMRQNGIDIITNVVNDVLEKDSIDFFEYGIVEYESKFDEFKNGRMQDIAIWGKTKSNHSIHIGVEAKVDEEFGKTIEEAIKEAEKALKNSPNSMKKERIKKLSNNVFKLSPESISHLRYQLLHYTAGTIGVDADIHIMLILVFKTSKYQDAKGMANFRDFECYMKTLGDVVDEFTYDLSRFNKSTFAIYKEILY